MKQTGTVFVHKGLWYYAVKLPGEKKRRQVPLRAACSKHTLAADRPREMAEQAAARYWERETRQVRRGDPASVTVEDVVAAYCRHAETYYKRADGSKTSEVAQIVIGLRIFRKMYGRAAVSELTHPDVVRWRDAVERSGVARTTVNKRIGILKRMIAWALETGMISATVRAELSQVMPLKRGRSIARETPPVRPVADEVVETTIAAMMPNTADMIRVQMLTGMRPEEVCALRWADIDTSAEPWVYRPGRHKNQWRNIPRVVCIGPRAREILGRHRPASEGEREAAIFSPRKAMREWMLARVAAQADGKPGNAPAASPHVPRALNERWRTDTYTGSIAAACRRIGVAAWGANRLRHSFATKVRRRFGLEAARAVLGHTGGGCVTDIYTFDAIEEEMIRAATPAVEALG